MAILIVGLVLFSMSHLIPSFPKMRENIIGCSGLKRYKLVFSLVSAISVGLIVYGFNIAPGSMLYVPTESGNLAAIVLMFPATYLFMSNSVASPPSSAQFYTAHPLNWGVILWCISHLVTNGDLPGVIMFSTFLLVSLVSIYSGNKRGAKPKKDVRPPVSRELVFLIAVAIVYSALLWGHGYIAGRPVIGF